MKALQKILTGCLSLLGITLLWLSLATMPSGCANIVPPLGGDKDTLAPVLTRAMPNDSTVNFAGKKITLLFDEYIQVDNVNENLIVSPTPKLAPEVTARLKTLTITIKDTLLPNTTYTFDFGNAIKDINENNILRNYSYTFSTGPALDQGMLSGNVLIAETGKADSTLIAMLYSEGDDSTVYKEKPRYITRVNRDGKFLFKNLPSGKFYLYALKDEGNSKRYMSKKQLFAFADEPVTIGATDQATTLYAYADKEDAKTENRTNRIPAAARTAAANDKKLRFETNLENGELDLLKQLEFYFKTAPLKAFDSTKVVFTDDKYAPISNYRLAQDTTNTRLTLQYSWKENTQYYLLVDKAFATDTAGRQLVKNDTLTFRTRKAAFYGTVHLRFLNLDLKTHPVLQFIQNGTVVKSHVFTSREFTAPLFLPGEYELRILFDSNQNGIWDPGQFFGTRRQPEKVRPIERKINVKPNWDNEIDITL